LILGVGIGTPPSEFARFGKEVDPKIRAAMLDEGLEVLTGLWSGEPFSFHGRHYQIDEATLLPRPVQQPRIPIWVGGTWPRKPSFLADVCRCQERENMSHPEFNLSVPGESRLAKGD
jgi:alkanesulfonate monooxygenase SsuD/methylene tetrahydromethanopterin reductase-like flavin-dependent oxidoreductase (luciferase family)